MKQYHKINAGIVSIALTALFMQLPLKGADKMVASFAGDDSLKAWTSVNDGVMGGVSKGGFKRTKEGTLLFQGELSLANNGGFASLRMDESELGLAGMKSIIVKARGDGRTYWVDLRVKNQMGATSYRANLSTTANEWKETTIPIEAFKLQAFGQDLPFKAVDPGAIASVGFTLADKKAGPFALEIEYVKATGEAGATENAGKPKTKGKNTLVDVAKAAGGFDTLLAAVTAADLVGVLSGDGPFTILAPTDEAFSQLPPGTVEGLLRPENRDQLVAILKNHVIAGRVTLAKALDAREADSLQGSKISFQFQDGRVLVGNAVLVKADIEASNGIIHVIDQVLLPATDESQVLTPSGLIELAIDRGVPVFNDGDVAGCAAIYEITIEALRTMESVPPDTRLMLAKALNEARAEASMRHRAWMLRGAIDEAFSNLEESP